MRRDPVVRVSAASVSTTASSRPMSSSRTVARSNRPTSERRAASVRTSSSDASSAHWRSSSTMTSGRTDDAATTRCATDSNMAKRLASPAGPDPRSLPVVSSRRARSAAASGCSAASARRTGNHGQNTGVAPPSNARPQRTRRPERSAMAATASTSRVLPMPGSPSITAQRVAVRASASACTSADASRSRPISPSSTAVPSMSATGGTTGATAAGTTGSGTIGRSRTWSWTRIACSSSRSGRPRSTPSSSRRAVRASSIARNASAWRPER